MAAWQACPGRGLNYPELSSFHFGGQPSSWLSGPVVASYLGYSADEAIRRQGASAGVLTHVLAALLDRGEVDGVVVLEHGQPEAWLSRPIIATSRQQILASSQSVYIPIPVNSILDQAAGFAGKLGYVGLPDQVASLRRLQAVGHPTAQKFNWLLGPYVGTSMYALALSSYLRSHGRYSLDDVDQLRYRQGEWPGHLMIQTKDGQRLKAAKFYYNYLIPFFITQSCLLTMDFTNELTDISVGDAWSPGLELRGEGYSVVLARNQKAKSLLEDLAVEGQLVLEPIELSEALSMHGHMLDFKKRGAYIRTQFRRWLGLAAPDLYLKPKDLTWLRYLTEGVIFLLFLIGGSRPARWLMERIPTSILGPLFEWLRQTWKRFTKPVKREGIWSLTFELVPGAEKELENSE
jgi:coenzyme F420 hydrogenase subunit beta